MIKCIVAFDDEYGIGKNNSLPWPYHKRDMMWFKQHTSKNIVVMGSNTWISLQEKAPLPNRTNVVVSSRNRQLFPAADHVIESLNTNTINRLKWIYPKTDIFCIGGAQLITSSLEIIDEFLISRINGTYNCDVFLPWKDITTDFYRVYQQPEKDVTFERWERK